jgi:hypothetical protein
MCAGTLVTMLWVIVAGLANFQPFAADACRPARFTSIFAWIFGLSGALRIAIYDYLGYYNICYLGARCAIPPGRSRGRSSGRWSSWRRCI